MTANRLYHCGDFDRRLAPLTSVTRKRRQSIAAARRTARPCPPSTRHRDGAARHRDTVARAGEECIEAEVTVWEMCARRCERATSPAVAGG